MGKEEAFLAQWCTGSLYPGFWEVLTNPTMVSSGTTGRGAQGRLQFKPRGPEGEPGLEARGSRNLSATTGETQGSPACSTTLTYRSVLWVTERVTFTSSFFIQLAKSEILQLVCRCTLKTGNHFTHTSTLSMFSGEPQI